MATEPTSAAAAEMEVDTQPLAAGEEAGLQGKAPAGGADPAASVTAVSAALASAVAEPGVLP